MGLVCPPPGLTNHPQRACFFQDGIEITFNIKLLELELSVSSLPLSFPPTHTCARAVQVNYQ